MAELAKVMAEFEPHKENPALIMAPRAPHGPISTNRGQFVAWRAFYRDGKAKISEN